MAYRITVTRKNGLVQSEEALRTGALPQLGAEIKVALGAERVSARVGSVHTPPPKITGAVPVAEVQAMEI